jgi:hypothetical protein
MTVRARLEDTAAGRVLVNLVLVATLLSIVVVNLPTSQLKQDLARLTTPYIGATGLDQNWAVFSSPRILSAYVYGVVEFADGSTTTVGIDTRPGLGAYVDYRWQKYEEVIRPDDGAAFWPPYARYLARQVRHDGPEPVQVSLVRRWSDTNPPGPGPARGPWQQHTFYVLRLGGGG